MSTHFLITIKLIKHCQFNPAMNYRAFLDFYRKIPDGTTHYGGFGCYYRHIISGWKVLHSVKHPYTWEKANADCVISFNDDNCDPHSMYFILKRNRNNY